MENTMIWDFVWRLVLAALFGTIIGLDREYREKEAGFRTHFLVSLGSALMMIVSQYGFSEILTHDGVSLDPSRIAAQVVSGIGFIGAGTIIFNHQIVRGLTTAASLWATAGIGLTAGAGMSWLALAATILTLVALEGLSLVFRSLGSRRMVVVFSASDRAGVADTLDRIRTDGYMVVSYEVVPQVVGGDGITYRVTMVVKAKPGSDNNQLLALLRENTDIIVERIAYNFVYIWDETLGGFLTGITTWWRKKIIAVRHSFYRKRLVRRLTNLAPSILSLDCVGGVMAHDLRLRFNSPTVNLFFESCGDFIDYVADLRYYSQAELCECPYAYEGARRYPVGMLKGNGTLPDIKIHFSALPLFRRGQGKMARAQRSS